MAITTYAELKTAISSWLDRDDLTSVIPDFIMLAEHQMNREVRHYKMTERSSANLDSRYNAVPADWLETIRFTLTTSSPSRLQLISIDEMASQRENSNNTTGRPKFYCHIGDSFELYPTPDGTYASELVYYEKITPLSDSNTSNWLLADGPDAYLYGALSQAAPYLGEDERIAVWSGLYNGAVASLNTSSDRTKNSNSSLKMKISAY